MTGENAASLTAKNVIAVLPGANPALNGQALIVSAHYDHLGYGWPDARADAKGQLYPGADDNASGVAVMLELARLMVMANERPERSVIFASFAGEEAGLLGARHYVKAAQAPAAPFPLSGHIANLNLDAVGRLEGGKVTIFGYYITGIIQGKTDSPRRTAAAVRDPREPMSRARTTGPFVEFSWHGPMRRPLS
jgi:Zn-dependent M28 family amino/carboxypeptidase